MGDDAKKVISEQAKVLARQAPTPTHQEGQSYALTYQLLIIPSTVALLMLENAILIP